MILRKEAAPILIREKNTLTPNVSSRFIIVPNSKITDEEISKLFQKYPPLNDGVPVELKQMLNMKIEQYIMENGKKMEQKDMVEEYKYGQMEVGMKDIGKKIKQMLEAN